jgi:hypothetical protein
MQAEIIGRDRWLGPTVLRPQFFVRAAIPPFKVSKGNKCTGDNGRQRNSSLLTEALIQARMISPVSTPTGCV